VRRQGTAPPPGHESARLQALFDPRSVTVLGASDDPAKWGHVLALRAMSSCGERPVRLVNHRSDAVLGRPTDATLSQARRGLGEPLDLVVLCVPAPALAEAVADAVAEGARSLVVITAGLSELGEAGAEIEHEVVRLVRAAGALMVGPNCLGIVDTTTDLQLTHDLLPPGDVAVLSQSGNVVLDLAVLLQDRGLGVSRFVSVGNQAALSVVDLMEACVTHDGTRAVAIYSEDVVDGRGFVDVARRLDDAGKPVVLLAPGRSEAAVRTAVSHTGSLVSASRVVDAACRAADIHRVDNPTQMADLLEGLRSGRRMRGCRAVVLTDGGGHGAIAADALATVGVETPVLGDDTRSVLRPLLRESSSTANPVDLAGAGERDLMTYARCLAALLEAEEVDGVVVTGYFGSYSTQPSALAALELQAAREMGRLVRRHGKPVVVQMIHPAGLTAGALREAAIPVHRDIDRAAAVLSALVDRDASADLLPLPPPRPPVADTSYVAARMLFADAGVSFPPARTVTDGAELDAAIAEVGVPLVLKALGRVHKSEGGGVVVGLQSAEEARAAHAQLEAHLRPSAVSVEAMADTTAGVEVIIGCVSDRRFGPLVMVGLGGVFTEVLADTSMALAPVSSAGARRMLVSLRAAPLLLGTRGREPVDLGSLAATVARVSEVAAAHPELAELELNPVLAGPGGAVALDARLVSEARDVATVAVVEPEDPGVLGGEDPVVEGT
jgi:acetate---CoA ligase (ADP-forming)